MPSCLEPVLLLVILSFAEPSLELADEQRERATVLLPRATIVQEVDAICLGTRHMKQC